MPKGLSQWIERIRDRDMPIFGKTADEIQRITLSETSTASSLAHAILQDAAMTARILKLANSAYFNGGQPQVSTISRAIVVLGFDLVRDLALSVALVDILLTGGSRQRVVSQMARSFHAAVQARAAAERRDDGSPEEVFIATLLLHLGEMAFWCFGGDEAQVLDRALKQPGAVPAQLEQALLGFSLRQLSAGLAREWRLSPLLQSALESSGRPGSRESGIAICCRLAAAVESGWDSSVARAAAADYASHIGQPLAQVLPQMKANAEAAARMAASYGADAAARLIPIPSAAAALLEADAAKRAAPGQPLAPDPLLQLAILREVSALILAGGSLYDLLDLVLEGIYRGVGMDRVLVALLASDRPILKAKVCLGDQDGRLLERFRFAAGDASQDALSAALDGQNQWVQRGAGGDAGAGFVSPRMRAVMGGGPYFLAPLMAQGRAIGLLYADRAASSRPLIEADFHSFVHFAQQASLGLGLMASRGRRSGAKD